MQTQTNWYFLVRLLHWASALVLAGCVAAVWLADDFEKGGALRKLMVQLHFLGGVSLAVLVGMRLLVRAGATAPVHEHKPWVAVAVKVTHWSMYGLLVAVPLCGYLGVSGRGVPIDVLGLFELLPTPVTKEFAHTAKEIHEVLANTLLWLVGFHMAAVVYHSAVLKDKVLASMTGRAN